MDRFYEPSISFVYPFSYLNCKSLEISADQRCALHTVISTSFTSGRSPMPSNAGEAPLETRSVLWSR